MCFMRAKGGVKNAANSEARIQYSPLQGLHSPFKTSIIGIAKSDYQQRFLICAEDKFADVKRPGEQFLSGYF